MAKSKKAARKSKPESPQIDLGRVLRPEFFGGLFILLAGAMLVALFFPGGVLGVMNVGVRSLFGWSAFFTPLLLLALGLGLLWQHLDPDYRLGWQESLGWFVLFVVSLVALQALGQDPDLLLARQSGAGGGIAGYLLLHGLRWVAGPAGAVVIVVIFTLAALWLAFGLSIWRIPGLIASGILAISRWYRDLLFPLVHREAEAEPEFAVAGNVAALNGDDEEDLAPTGAVPPARARGLTSKFILKKSDPGEEQAPAPQPVVRGDWQLPPVSTLETAAKGEVSAADLRKKVEVIEGTLKDFNVQARVVEVNQGPAVTQFGVEPGFHETRDRTGVVIRREKVKVNEITSLQNDLALSLAAPTIRIEAPVPGKNIVGIEVPNSSTATVTLRDVIETEKFQKLRSKSKLAVALGEDVSGRPAVADLAKMPHLLIAGATGSGKSVCLNAIVTCLLLQTTPDELRLLMIDPKRVELTHFNDAPHLLRPVVVEVDKAVSVLKWVMFEMEQRYKRFEAERVRNIDDYNKLMAKREEPPLHYIVVIIDELADLMMTAAMEVEPTICRLAQLARATGIHLIVATQRPSVDVVTGLIKTNFPTRISFAMFSLVDSRTILDRPGAEKLLGRGDMLYMPPDASKPIRLQGVYVSDEEIKEVVSFWCGQGPAKYVETLVNIQGWSPEAGDGKKDELYDKAVDLARQHSHISTSLLQRRLGIGYGRAARIIDQMEEAGIVGASENGKSREVLLTEETGAISEPSGAVAESF